VSEEENLRELLDFLDRVAEQMEALIRDIRAVDRSDLEQVREVERRLAEFLIPTD